MRRDLYRHSKIPHPAPVNGGGRWRAPRHDIMEALRRDPGAVIHDPDASADESPDPTPVELGPRIVSDPPTGARVGEEYVYQARAQDAHTDGFTWYFEQGVPGLTVDRHSGRVVWIPTEGGYHQATLCARSVYGATSRQSWTVRVRRAAPRRAFAANPRYAAALSRKLAGEPPPLPRAWSAPEEGRSLADRRATAPPARLRRIAIPLRL